MVRTTSKQSYKELHDQGKINPMESIVYMGLKLLGNGTDSMITQSLGFDDPNKIRPRRHSLVEKGLIEGYKKEKCPITNKTVYWWRITK